MISKLFLSVILVRLFFLSTIVHGQTITNKGITKVIEFTNETAKFIVPESKTWYISNVFSTSYDDAQNMNYVLLKKINNTEFKDNSPILSNYARVFFNFPIILPEKTTFEIELTVKSAKAVMIYTEVDN